MQKRNHLLQETIAILKPFRLLIIMASVLGIVSGLCITALLATINKAMNADAESSTTLLWGFTDLCLAVLVCTTLSNLSTSYVGQNVVKQLRQRLASQVLMAPIEQLERYRSHRLIPVLVHDINTISGFALNLAPLVISLAISLGCLSYLAFLSWQILLVTVLTVIVGGGAQYLAYRFGWKHLNIARDAEDSLQKHYRAIADGAKELRIQRSRRQQMLEEKIQSTTQRICSANINSANIFISAETFGSMLFFVVIGMAITVQTFWPTPDKTVLGGFVLVMLYMKGPLEQFISTLPRVTQAQVAFERIAEFSSQFSSPEPDLLANNESSQKISTAVQSIEFRNLYYQFPPVDDLAPFVLGPLNLRIEKGEIVFIVGENGSGKTTLIKLLLGLYKPIQGTLLLNGKAVNTDNLDDYRQLFTTIFADYYLFEDLVKGQEHLPEQAEKYLHRLKIAHKVKIRDGAFNTTDLSTGQRKRLALINAWLEQRPVLVFDEWAADQDPAFRRIFYTELLPDLKRLGKTIIVISHDDRYFDSADRVIKMESGKILMEEEAFA